MLTVSIRADLGQFRLNADMRASAGTTVLFGRSGCGKTSLVNIIAGLSRAQEAEISLDDTTLVDTKTGVFVPPHERQIGYVFQDARLFPHLDVAKNLDYGARFAANPLTGRDRAQLIDTLGIDHLLTRRPGALSGGERQRVALGRALMTRPRLLLLDEPLTGLDAARKDEILPYLDRLRGDRQPPMIYVTHDMNEIVRLADNLVVMRDGTCVVQGAATDVLSDPANVPLIGVQDAGALLTGTVAGHTSDGLTRLQLSREELLVPKLEGDPGATVRVRLRAQHVALSLTPPADYSGLNVFAAQITEIKPGQGPGVAVALQSGRDRFLSRLTARAVQDLGLKTGMTVFVLINASAVPAAALAAAEN
ncbi:MAG: molybdenum ABC transporter ATP-binding protein [Pseudomonadota bacterium]